MKQDDVFRPIDIQALTDPNGIAANIFFPDSPATSKQLNLISRQVFFYYLKGECERQCLLPKPSLSR
ncbi:hypothetical protein [Candidatus Endomicrobiellum trichonymphae]|uniref:hypothetical protein n=1 Tax=Endomicrobium trichonymphae TaxID=1408204 RepID=UPI000F657F86|nr:hypothetical protein [Candidatus Endomicrobium trichonymphae]